MIRPPLAFTEAQAQAAAESWRFNCGPGAVAAVLGVGPEDIRPYLLDFERRGYTNPKLMLAILNGLGLPWMRRKSYPALGLVRIQWAGPWCDEGRPMRARYRHTHWIAYCGEGDLVFDVNAVGIGGWIPFVKWESVLVPWLLKECEPKASGLFYATDILALNPILCAEKGRELTGARHAQD